jgi:hypothetical protein
VRRSAVDGTFSKLTVQKLAHQFFSNMSIERNSNCMLGDQSDSVSRRLLLVDARANKLNNLGILCQRLDHSTGHR